MGLGLREELGKKNEAVFCIGNKKGLLPSVKSSQNAHAHVN